MNWLLLLTIVAFIALSFVLIKIKKSVSLVKENSNKFKKLSKLNESYEFYYNVKKEIIITHYVRSQSELASISLNNLLIDMFKDNISNITLNFEYIKKNEKNCELYLKKYNAINDVTEPEIIATTNMKLKNFLFLENSIFKNNKLKPITKFKVKIIAKYDGPKGKNKYQKDKVYNFNDLNKFYEEYKNEKEVK